MAVIVVIVLGLATMTGLVYTRMAVELAKRTRESIVNRVMTVEAQIASVYSLAADEAMNLMSLMDRGEGFDERALAEQLGAIQAGLVGCSSAWIVPVGRRPIIAPGTSRTVLASRTWWRPYLERAGALGLGRAGSFASLGIRRNIGYVGPAFRGSTGIGTILPLVVVRYSGTERLATAFFEIDMTVILDGQLNAPAALGGGQYPLEISFYDPAGSLLETTANLPLVRVRPFGPEAARPPVLAENASILEYLLPGPRGIEAAYRDERMGLLCVGRTPARLVMRQVLEVATYVLVVGALALGSVLVLGILLLAAYRQARSFEKEQLLARFEALQAKVNPHFLFNTLDSMIGVAEERDFGTLMRMLRALSLMLHMTVRRTKDIVSLGEELDYVRAYLAIQEVRYRDGFATVFRVDEAALSAPICRFGLQPIVENCFTHGVHEGRLGMTITIAAWFSGGDVRIEVGDDGPGCLEETRAALVESFARGENRLGREGGLFNLHTRLGMSFGEGYGLELPETAGGFVVGLRIPAAPAGRDVSERKKVEGR
jgi:hypothetical protein